jgi:hypothetical protein
MYVLQYIQSGKRVMKISQDTQEAIVSAADDLFAQGSV